MKGESERKEEIRTFPRFGLAKPKYLSLKNAILRQTEGYSHIQERV